MVLGACRTPTRQPNVLFILIDTLRADRLGCYGNASGLTPFLDRFTRGATVFRNAYATSSWTAPSVASLFTSRYPSQHGVVSVVSKLNDQEITLAETLAQHGYRAGAVVANDVVAPRIGYDQGFESFRNVAPNAEPVLAQGLEWLDSVHASAPAAPVLLYLHFMDPHWPYTPPQAYVDRFAAPNLDAAAAVRAMSRKIGLAFNEQYVSGATDAHRQFTCEEIGVLESLYDAEVAALDAQLERLFTALEQRRFLDNTLVIITSDHGEEFFEHGGLWHAYTLYEESIRVPLIVRVPGQGSGRIVEQTVSLLDVAPSILRYIGIERPTTFEGTSFADRLGGAWLPAPRDLWRRWTGDAPLFAELEGESERQPQLRAHAAAIIERGQKLLIRSHGDPELYDLMRDPREEQDLGATTSAMEADLLARLHAVQGAIGELQPSPETVTLDDATRDRLKALGYGLADAQPVTASALRNDSARAHKASPTRRDLCLPPPAGVPTAAPVPEAGRSFF